MRVLFPFLVCTALLTLCAVSSAQETAPTPAQIKKAARAFDKAKEAYEIEDYATAAVEFESADGHAPSAVALQWAIDSHDQAGHLARAATLAALAKQRHPEVAELNGVADAVIEKARAELFQLDVSCDEPCELLVDNKIVHGRPASSRTLFLDPGMYQVTASFSDSRMSDSQDVGADAGAQNNVTFSPPEALGSMADEDLSGMSDPFETEEPLEADPTFDEGPKVESGGLHPAMFWVGAGLTVVSGAATVFSGIDTQNNPGREAVKEECQRPEPNDCRTLYDEGVSKQNRTNLLLGVTGGLAVVTVVLALVTDWGSDKQATGAAKKRPPQRKAGLEVDPFITFGNGAIVGASARF